ncbi:hypothetical protein E5843_13480 [Luteimonas yindakuii]|uniref:hypothetical protein n=1 Tax=Luteimonas yindakuii TaxID=2565782 RepID=UPI0010A36ECA|nr:hypothetical protein [Luteimonas yindakuii]QCO68523.1 hypothetical protein E5843_13480 [Luteimonas yindakuii]
MVRNLLVALLLAVVALVAHENGRRISEADVRAHYRQQLEALIAFDSEAICKPMAADFELRNVEHVDGTAHRQTMDRRAACQQMEDAIALMRVINNQTGGLVGIDFGYEITRIEIMPGGRRAVVEATSTARLGGRLLSRSRSKGELSRSMWRVRDHGGQAQTWSYGG